MQKFPVYFLASKIPNCLLRLTQLLWSIKFCNISDFQTNALALPTYLSRKVALLICMCLCCNGRSKPKKNQSPEIRSVIRVHLVQLGKLKRWNLWHFWPKTNLCTTLQKDGRCHKGGILSSVSQRHKCTRQQQRHRYWQRWKAQSPLSLFRLTRSLIPNLPLTF